MLQENIFMWTGITLQEKKQISECVAHIERYQIWHGAVNSMWNLNYCRRRLGAYLTVVNL